MILLVSLVISTQGVSQDDDRTREVVSKSYPLATEASPFHEDFKAFYVGIAMNRADLLDTLYAPLAEAETQLTSKVDSAGYLFFTAKYHLMRSEYELAKELFSESGLLFHQLGDERAELAVKIQFANINYYLKEVQTAYDQYQEVLAHPACDAYMTSNLNHNSGALLMELESEAWNDPDPAVHGPVDKRIEEHLKYAIDYSRKTGNRSAMAWAYSVYATHLLKRERYEETQAILDSCDLVARELNDMGRLAFVRLKKAVLLDSMGLHQAAIDTTYLALEHFQDELNQRQSLNAKGQLYTFHMNAGEYRKAALMAKEMFDDRSAVFSDEMAAALQASEVEFETAKKEMRIKEQEIELENERLKVSNRNRSLAAAILGGLGLVSLLLFLLQRNKRIARQEQDAILIESKQKGINAMIAAQEEERQRIAKELHDGIVQQLGGLKLGMEKQLSDQEDPASQRLIKILDDSTQELRELSHRMMPRALSELGLLPALEDTLENSLGLSDMRYTFEHFGMEERLEERIEITLYRIAQELINNVIKHSAASEVNVQLFRTADEVVLIVEDDGRGMGTSNTESGIGLMNISSRLDTVNGRVNFEPSPGSGTLATIRIPL